MTDHGYCLFDTAIGACALAWGPGGIVGVQLPEASPAATRARLARRFPQAREGVPPAALTPVIAAAAALVGGQAADLSASPLDWAGVPEFERRVYEIALTVPPGQTLTYGEIARRLGEPGAARAVGRALGRNPFPIIVPCHRVLAAQGGAGGFSARGGIATKLKLLSIERARVGDQPTLFDGDPSFGLAARPRRADGPAP